MPVLGIWIRALLEQLLHRVQLSGLDGCEQPSIVTRGRIFTSKHAQQARRLIIKSILIIISNWSMREMIFRLIGIIEYQ